MRIKYQPFFGTANPMLETPVFAGFGIRENPEGLLVRGAIVAWGGFRGTKTRPSS
jgi:hypothetical protein